MLTVVCILLSAEEALDVSEAAPAAGKGKGKEKAAGVGRARGAGADGERSGRRRAKRIVDADDDEECAPGLLFGAPHNVADCKIA